MIFIESKNPNLFNPVTMINYEFPMTSDVELSVYNLFGQKVVTLVNCRQGAGYHQVEWDASKMASDIYYYQLVAGEFAITPQAKAGLELRLMSETSFTLMANFAF